MFNKFKVWLFKARNKFQNRLLISSGHFPLDFIFRVEGFCRIGKNFHARKNCFVRVRKGGRLIIGDRVSINNRCSIVCHNLIEIGDDVLIGENVAIYDHDHNFDGIHVTNKLGFNYSPVKIGDNVWIGSNVLILSGVSIGDNCVIGGGTILTKSIPENSIVYSQQNLVIRTI